MSAQFKIILFLISFVTIADSQNQLKLNLFDQDKKPVPYAIVKYEDRFFTSNSLGHLKINNYTSGNKVFIQKLGFTDTVIVFHIPQDNKDTSGVNIILQSQVFFLEEIPIYSNKLREINSKKSDFILNYELSPYGLVELLSNNNLLIYDNQDQIKGSLKSFPSTESITKDPFGTINIVTERYSYKTSLRNFSLTIDSTPIPQDKFKWALKYCDGVLDSIYFIRRYKNNNQTVVFWAISPTKQQLLKRVSNSDKIKTVKANLLKVNQAVRAIQYYSSSNLGGIVGDIDTTELRLRRHAEFALSTYESIYSQPSYNILKCINDSIYIFAHDIDTLLAFDKRGNLIRTNYIDYHHLKLWDKEIIANEEKTKVYAKFLKNQTTLLAEINLNTGQIELPFFKIESGHFIKKIRITGNRVYFISKQQNGVGNTVYTQNLQICNLKLDHESFNLKNEKMQRDSLSLYFGRNPKLFYNQEQTDTISSPKSMYYFKKAILRKTDGDYEDALSFLKKALKLRPDFADAWFNSGLIYFQLKNTKDAIICYNKVIELDPDYYAIYQQRGLAKHRIKDFNGAVSDYRLAFKFEKDNPFIYFNIAKSMLELKNTDSALYFYDRAIKIDSTFWQASYNRGNLNFELRRLSEALMDFNNAIKHNHTNKLIYFQRGIAYDELKQHTEAIDDFNKAIELDPLFIDAYIYAGNSLAETGDFKSAIDKFSAALRLDPNNVTAYFNRATSEFKSKNYKKALSDYSKVLRIKPDLKKAFYYRGICELELGMIAEACLDFMAAGNIGDAIDKTKTFCK